MTDPRDRDEENPMKDAWPDLVIFLVGALVLLLIVAPESCVSKAATLTWYDAPETTTNATSAATYYDVQRMVSEGVLDAEYDATIERGSASCALVTTSLQGLAMCLTQCTFTVPVGGESDIYLVRGCNGFGCAGLKREGLANTIGCPFAAPTSGCSCTTYPTVKGCTP
jgi:hypothetical protein